MLVSKGQYPEVHRTELISTPHQTLAFETLLPLQTVTDAPFRVSEGKFHAQITPAGAQ